MKRCPKFLGGLALACGLILAQGTEPGAQPKTTPADLAEGGRIFGTQCSYCHGPKGEGGQGAVLAVPRLPHAPDDQALFHVIHEGIPGTRMPASALTTAQVWQVAAFVRSLGRVEGSKASGDARHGQQVFAGKAGCARCHTVGGRGGAVGPELGDIGARQSAAEIRTSIVDPDAVVPFDYMQVRVTAKDGRNITGVRLNEDTFSIQIRDLSNQFHSLLKTEVSEIVKEPKKSIMPSYRSSLTPEELDDVVAYLASLQGAK